MYTVIAANLKEAYRMAEPVNLEFAGLMRSTFAYYSELQALFLNKLSKHLHESELIALLNTEIRPRLFNHSFCERIPEALKALRRSIIRLEDLRAAHPDLPEPVNTLATLVALAEQVEALYQKHWEYYRYQNNLTEPELVAFLLDVERIGYEWDVYLEGFLAIGGVIKALSGKPLPEHAAAVRVAYQRSAPEHFAAESLTALMAFFQSCYRFICAVHAIDACVEPLTLLQVEIGEPVEVMLAVPAAAEESFRRFLQYLFLKDMLQREALLKFVMEAIQRQYRPQGSLESGLLQGFQREIAASLKNLPENGRFRISDRIFPEDGVRVMHEFFVSLEEKAIPHESLLQAGGEKLKHTGKMRKSPKPGVPSSLETGDEPPGVAARPNAASTGEDSTVSTGEHIRVLTDRELGYGPVTER